MPENEKLIQDFYTAFGKGQHQTMQQMYDEDATFTDPVFMTLNSKEVQAMWEMLVTSAKDLKIQASDFHAEGDSVTCVWQAWYTFTKTGRPVHNIVHATFTLREGRIKTHTDTFDLWRWSRQALGLSGILLGWTPLIQGSIRKTARARLEKFMNRTKPK